MEFKVGDKVKCIKPMAHRAVFNTEDTYVVSGVDQAGIHLCFEHTGQSCWHGGRFEVIQPKQFSPKPGDKIICNNGEELTCCTLEFLQEDTLALYMKNDSIFAYQIAKESKIYHKYDWMCWKMDGSAYGQEWSIKEIIPAQQEVKQERTEETFTEFEIIRAYEDWNEGEAESLISVMKSNRKRVDPEYKMYLELKAKFEGKE